MKETIKQLNLTVEQAIYELNILSAQIENGDFEDEDFGFTIEEAINSIISVIKLNQEEANKELLIKEIKKTNNKENKYN